ncbi:MAG: DSD1 family PLP-dependent enzyme [Hyphomicrobiaceae bacterium]|nr:DSD1 family PLP-dependent enzyme [Hyphomicrobiaceae bacterium]
MPAPARPGMPFDDVDTPALIVDLDALERNLERMADLAGRHGVRLRPHAKTHKSPVIALRQMALGAVGVCCQKVSEAETMVRGGVGDVLLTNEIAGARKLERLAWLAHEARVGVCTDSLANVRDLERAAARAGVRLDVLVEIDCGGRRCGAAPGRPATEIACAIAGSPHLSFAGLHAYHGSAQHFRTGEERRDAIALAGGLVQETLAVLGREGLSCRIVGGAGTGTFELEAASGIWNELQPGSYVFMDADYARNQKADGGRFDSFEHALFVLATVMSTPSPERAILDAGHKALSNDSGFPEVPGLPGAKYHRPSDEHGILDLTGCEHRPGLGDKLLLIPGHCDPTVNLHDWYVGVRGLHTPGAHVASVWRVAARGAIF